VSRENVDLIRRGFERWIGGGASADSVPVELYADDVEWDLSAYPLVDFETRGSGRDALLSNMAGYFAGWRDYEADVREFIDAGDDVIAVLHEAARIGDSGSLIEREVAQVWTVRDGLVVRWRIFETREQALEAVGLRE
jgi:ketosteroid isomerase-like protein